MITGIEEFDKDLQKSILEFIANNMDMTEDIEVEEFEENVIEINGYKFYVITDAEAKGKLATYNSEEFDIFFENLDSRQREYIDEDKWYEDYGLSNFKDWITETTNWSVSDADYYGHYNFYEIH
jgi:hypothetical protein